jgi:dTDP-4-amino-4,6-dideoxygalactose transaminase
MDRISDVARRHNLSVIEDAAQGVNSFYKDRALGSIGRMGCFSFHETKNYICGEGGALCLNDPALIERAEIIRDKGTNRRQFFRGEVDKYTWVDVGSSFIPSELCSAFLFAQLELLDQISERRRQIYEVYQKELTPLAEAGLIRLPHVPAECRSNSHLFYVILRTASEREALLEHFRREKILAVFHYVPLHTSPVGRSFGYRDGQLPVTEDLSARLVRLPMFHDFQAADQSRVIAVLKSFLKGAPA